MFSFESDKRSEKKLLLYGKEIYRYFFSSNSVFCLQS